MVAARAATVAVASESSSADLRSHTRHTEAMNAGMHVRARHAFKPREHTFLEEEDRDELGGVVMH